MKIHEYQAKQLFAERGVPVPRGEVVRSGAEAAEAARKLGGKRWVVKAQVHAGGRGKGGGVKLVDAPAEAAQVAEQILSRPLVTPQTGPEGRKVRALLVEEAVPFRRELYLALTLDRAKQQVVLMGSQQGGMSIEEVAAATPEAIHKTHVDPLLGLTSFQARWMAERLGLERGQAKAFGALAARLYGLMLELDASLVEINPLVVTEADEVLALDGKINFDSSGLSRHPQLAELHDPHEEDDRELAAAQADLSYVSLDGDIGCMVNGAGLAMATMDLVLHAGGRPANFLDVGGAATVERVATAVNLILDDPRVRGVFVNIFGGIVRCDVVAEGLVAATRERTLECPLVVRLVGTNETEGKAILAASGLAITQVETMAEGAAAITRAVGGVS